MANYADGARIPRTLTEREQRALLQVTGEHRAGFRDHVLYAMANGTGSRGHELSALRDSCHPNARRPPGRPQDGPKIRLCTIVPATTRNRP